MPVQLKMTGHGQMCATTTGLTLCMCKKDDKSCDSFWGNVSVKIHGRFQEKNENRIFSDSSNSVSCNEALESTGVLYIQWAIAKLLLCMQN